MGRTEPRLFTHPLRPLTRRTTRGYEVCDFADQVLGEPLLPWQRWLVIHGLETSPTGGYRFRTVVVEVARQNGKTHLLRTLSLWRLFVDGARLILGAAQSLDIAREAWQASVDTAQGIAEMRAEIENVRYANGEQCLTLTGGGRYRVTAATRSAGRGLSVDQLNLDELREQRDWAAWGALSKTTMARPHAQTWAFSNAGDDQSVVLNHLRDAALAGRDPSIMLAEWSAPDDCDLDDREAWRQANPGLGLTVSEQAIASARTTDPPAVFRTEVLCQRVDVLDSAVDMTAWRASTDATATMERYRDRVVVCLDVAPDEQHVTLVAAADTDDGRVLVETVAVWHSPEAAGADLPDLLERVDPRLMCWYPSGPAGALAPLMRAMGAHEIQGSEVTQACMSFGSLIKSRAVLHAGDELLYAHLAGASKLHQGDGYRYARKGAAHVDAAYAAAGAVHVLLTVPVESQLPQPMVV